MEYTKALTQESQARARQYGQPEAPTANDYRFYMDRGYTPKQAKPIYSGISYSRSRRAALRCGRLTIRYIRAPNQFITAMTTTQTTLSLPSLGSFLMQSMRVHIHKVIPPAATTIIISCATIACLLLAGISHMAS